MKLLFTLMFLLGTLALSTMAAAQDNSLTALIIRQDPSSHVLTTMQITNPNVQLNANQGADQITTFNTRTLDLQTDVQAYVASLLISGVIKVSGGQPAPLGNNLIILWGFGRNYIVTVIPDTGQTGTWLAYTGSVNTTIGVILDQLYKGL